jgi:D-glycero-alpha-D-manno-heptose 1-phosphate guanylyltransferase
MECIILAGGLGTRLRGIVQDVPKCMAPVAGEPFLAHLFNWLEAQMCDHVILSLGYKHEVVIEWLRNKAFTFKLSWVIEQEPLGTGGGIKRACSKSKENHVFVVNGDTMFDISLRDMIAELGTEDKAVLALKPMKRFDRYGSVKISEDGYITAFCEKQFQEEGLINGGIYLLNKQKSQLQSMPDRFSFEQDFLEVEVGRKALKSIVQDAYFIDIGVPEDYYRAQEDFKDQ